jgi:HK97 family phage prohead protease
MAMEIRTSPNSDFELRNTTDGPAPGTVVGYAAVWDSLSEDLGGFRERLKPWSMDTAISNDVFALYNHDSNLVIGRQRAGTLRVAPDARGLKYECDIPPTSYGKNLWCLLQRNDVVGASFGFTVAANGEEWSQDEAGYPVRTITEVKQLFEVSICAMPAYKDSSAAMASLRSFQAKDEALRRHVEAESRERIMRLSCIG